MKKCDTGKQRSLAPSVKNLTHMISMFFPIKNLKALGEPKISGSFVENFASVVFLRWLKVGFSSNLVH